MKQALVIGITGGFGGHVAAALLEDGWKVKALMRDPARLPPWHQGVEAVRGDAREIGDVRRAALPLLEPTARVAEEQGLTVVFPGNVYNFHPQEGPDFTEAAPFRPVSRKGAIRVALEERLRQATANGARVVLIRAGDFIGAHAGSTWMNVLAKRTDSGYRLLRPGPAGLLHTWANLPDVGRTVARLLRRRDRLPAFAPFHFEGYRVTFSGMMDAMRTAGGRPVRVWPLPWWAVTLLAPFIPFLRELREMRYLWRQEVNLDGHHLRETLAGEVPHTPLPEALVAAGVVGRS
jgi:uncharacterized protein YbjT (DUF2867 family)